MGIMWVGKWMVLTFESCPGLSIPQKGTLGYVGEDRFTGAWRQRRSRRELWAFIGVFEWNDAR